MEKGKSKKPLALEDDKGKDDKKKNDKGKDKDKSDKDEAAPKVPARQPLISGRPPVGSISRPGTSVSRPAPVSNLETTMPSASPSEDLPESTIAYNSKVPSQNPSQLPSTFAEDTLFSTLPSQAPSVDKTTLSSAIPSDYPSDAPMEESSSTPSQESSQTPSLEPAILNESESRDGQNEGKTAEKDSSTKVSISGDIMNKKEANVSIGKNGKVSFSSSDDDDAVDATTKISMSGVLSNKKYDDANISISKRGKVSFSGGNDDTPDPSPAPNQQKMSTKISLSGLLPSQENSSQNASKVSFSRSGDVDVTNSPPAPSYMPTYVPTTAYEGYEKQPSSSTSSGKISLSFPTSTNKNHNSRAPSTTSSKGFKPISSYTEIPTSDSTSLVPSKPIKEKNEKTPSQATKSESEEPTYFVYPTYYPTTVPDLIKSAPIPTYYPTSVMRESRNYDSESNYPTYWPSYMPTWDTKRLPSFGFGDASGRESNFGVIDFNTPEDDDYAINETLYRDNINVTSSENETTILDFMAIKPSTITSDQSHTNKNKEDEAADLYRKRICLGFPLGVDPSASKVEQKVFFTYGIEIIKSTGSNIGDVVEDIQRNILDDTASAILRCDGRRLIWGTQKKPVSRVYYKRDTAISTLSECTSSAESRQCAIVESAIYLTVIEGREDEARVETLSVINHRLEKNDYETGSVEYTHYLGPNADQLSIHFQQSGANALSSSETSSTPHLFYGAIAAVSLALCALFILVVMMIRNNMKKRRASIHYERFANSATPSRSIEPHSYDVSSPHGRTHGTSELSNWRSLVGRERF